MNNTAKFYSFPATDWDRQAGEIISGYLSSRHPFDTFCALDGSGWLGIRIWWYNEPPNLYEILRRCAEIRDQVKEQVLSQEFVE